MWWYRQSIENFSWANFEIDYLCNILPCMLMPGNKLAVFFACNHWFSSVAQLVVRRLVDHSTVVWPPAIAMFLHNSRLFLKLIFRWKSIFFFRASKVSVTGGSPIGHHENWNNQNQFLPKRKKSVVKRSSTSDISAISRPSTAVQQRSFSQQLVSRYSYSSSALTSSSFANWTRS